MTPKEKAKELHIKFMTVKHEYKNCMCGSIEMTTLSWDAAKLCALFAVKEIINSKCEHCLDNEYWYEVKQELEKL